MATDKKSQHVGNHGGVYTDNDGMSKQFTYIDHDKKPTISTHTTEKVNPNWQEEYRELLLQRITDLPASLCPVMFTDYTVRGDTNNVITWNTNMLSDKGVPISRLRDLCVMLENRAEGMRLIP